MIIDSHTHIHWTIDSDLRADYMAPGKRAGDFWGAEDLIKLMDRFGFDKSVAFPFFGDWEDDYMPQNKYVAEAAEKYPERLIPFAWLIPKHKRAIKDLETCVNDLGIKGIKLGPRYDGYFANAMRRGSFDQEGQLEFHDFYKRAAELGVPIIFHSGPNELGSPVALCNIADRIPELTIIIGHTGIWWAKNIEMNWVIEKYPNVYVETSGTHSSFAVQGSIDLLGADRVLFGTDAPCIEIEFEKRKIELLKVTEEDRKKIFGKNIARILNIKT